METQTKIPNGVSFKFYKHRYPDGIDRLQIGDRVVIAGKYDAVIKVCVVPTLSHSECVCFEDTNELCLVGIEGNINWEGAVIDKFQFERLKFVSR